MNEQILTAVPTAALKKIGILNDHVHYQLTPDELTKHTVERGQGVLSSTGALVINTGEFTGRSPQDKFIVKDEVTEHTVDWGGFNTPIDEQYFFQ